MRDASVFSEDFSADPYWWTAAPRPQEDPPALPARIDVAIVGSGFTGLSAAIKLAKAGRSVAVLDQGDAGCGASSRNMGFLGRVMKHELSEVIAMFGLERAVALYQETRYAVESVAAMVEGEAIDCHHRVCGRIMTARTERQYDSLARELELRRKHLSIEFEMLRGPAFEAEFGSESFMGGALVPELGSLHPGLYHLGLLAAARRAGAAIHPRTTVLSVNSERSGEVSLRTDRGDLIARDALIATNGYSGAAHPYTQRRVIPFNAFIVATAELPKALIDKLLPKHRTYIDCNFNVDSWRRSPDQTRLIYCGRTGQASTDPAIFAPRLKSALVRNFPELAAYPLHRAWTGRCAGTFDLFPHVGKNDGVHFAMGYCFSGLPMGTYLGGKAAAKILGLKEGATAFDSLDFRTFPLYRGNPWFVPLAMKWYDLKDRAA